MTDSFDKTYRNSGVEIDRYQAVGFDASGEIVVAGADEVIIGICQRDVADDVSAVPVRTGGHTFAIANNGSIEAGDRLKTASDGHVTSVGGESDTDVNVIGIAEEASAAQGDYIQILLAPSVLHVPA